MLGAQSAYAFIENNGRGKLNFSSCGKITANPEVNPRTGVMSGLATIVCHEHEKLARADRA
jgi:hypothetical protein